MEWNELATKMIVWTLFVYLGLTVCFFTVRNSVFLQCMFTIDEISQVDTIIRMHGEIYADIFSSEVSQLCFTGNKNVKKTGRGKRKSSKKTSTKKERNNSKMLICINLQSRHILTISRNMDTAGESISINVLFSRPNCCIKY